MQPGTVVQMKSGGPYMTIRFIEDGQAYCEWFEGAKNHGAKFALAQLATVDD